MAFVLSKLFWALFQPTTMLLLMLLVAVAGLLWRPGWRLARRATVIAFGLLAIASLSPAGHSLLWILEQRFPAPPAPPAVDGIVVLGGAVQPGLSADRGRVALNGQAERMTEAIILARQYPAARLVFTGGSAALLSTTETEAMFARRLFEQAGLVGPRFAYEDRSRNTFENAQFTKELAAPRPGESWLLVTSARHMPRAIGCFRAVGWNVVPWPVDFRTTRSPLVAPSLDMEGNLRELDDALHELIGLLAYRILGYTTALFPGP